MAPVAGRRCICVALALAACGCGGESARPQYVLVIDTDLPLVSQLPDRADLSPDAAVDTLLVESLFSNGKVKDSEEFVRPDPRDWPLSLGVAADDATLLRLTLFRSIFSARAVDDGSSQPLPEAAIERLLILPPTDGIVRIGVMLSGDCRGERSSLLTPGRTCVNATARRTLPVHGILSVDQLEPPSRAGSWLPAQERTCTGAPAAGRKCIAGGFSLLGDLDVSAGTLTSGDPIPLRPVVLDPFFMDEFEYSVARFQALLKRTSLSDMPLTPDPNHPFYQYCSWRGENDTSTADFALSCLTPELAQEICQKDGGRLPTEAEWEHAARGRGQRLRVPWGDFFDCCVASFGRGILGDPTDTYCEGAGPEAIGSHPPSEGCQGFGDVSRDGVQDLGGGVREWMLDHFESYQAPCWQESALLFNPVCEDGIKQATRGGAWSFGPLVSLPVMRGGVDEADSVIGFRCVYEDEP